MTRLPSGISFDAFLDYLFGYPIGPSGFREAGEDWWDEQEAPDLAVAHLARFFEAPEVALERYPRAQIDRGLWFLLGESGHLQPLFDSRLPWEDRRRALLGIASLYRRLLAPCCTPYLGHLDRGPEPPDPLNSICYMWWDLFPTWGLHGGEADQLAASPRPSRQQRQRARRLARAEARQAPPDATGELRTVDEALLWVMAETLRIESEACREGALHGLGHWHLNYPARTEAIVDAWLAERPSLSPELHRYALSARSGCVL